mmetsp:Transcript_17583/g.27516  ORF Transcript_17583/g.27516 Transcript_17583/m.27516 type:complete len:93 (+) Transcript_17583:208-486(+)
MYKWLGTLTCCARPFIVVSYMSELTNDIEVGDYKMRFDGFAGEYCSDVYCPICCCDIFTLGMYSCCGCAHKRRTAWFDAKTTIYPKELNINA